MRLVNDPLAERKIDDAFASELVQLVLPNERNGAPPTDGQACQLSGLLG